MFGVRRRLIVKQVPYTYQYDAGPWPEWPEPWRRSRNAASALWAPTWVLVALCDPERVRMLLDREEASLGLLEASVGTCGVERVLELVYDPRGRIRVLNGHHRIVVANRLGMPRLPVTLVPSDHIRGWSLSVSEVLPGLLPVAL